jgi:hypothetical protein
MADMIFRRKSREKGDGEDAGPCIVIPKGTKFRNRKVFAAGDELTVSKIEDLPGYPSSADGWKFVRYAGQDPKLVDMSNQAPDVKSVLKAEHHGGDKWKVIVDKPGYDCLNRENGQPLDKGVKVHPGFLSRESAESWVKNGYLSPPEELIQGASRPARVRTAN